MANTRLMQMPPGLADCLGHRCGCPLPRFFLLTYGCHVTQAAPHISLDPTLSPPPGRVAGVEGCGLGVSATGDPIRSKITLENSFSRLPRPGRRARGKGSEGTRGCCASVLRPGRPLGGSLARRTGPGENAQTQPRMG